MIFQNNQTILFKCNFYGEEQIFDGKITTTKENSVHVAFLLGLRPVHAEIKKNDIIAVFDKNAFYQEIGEYKGNFIKVS